MLLQFEWLDAELAAFVDTIRSAHPLNVVVVMVRTDMAAGQPDRSSGILVQILGNIVILAKRQFENFIVERVGKIAKAAAPGRGSGILPATNELEDFIRAVESIVEDWPRRQIVNSAYARLLNALFAAIKRIAGEGKNGHLIALGTIALAGSGWGGHGAPSDARGARCR